MAAPRGSEVWRDYVTDGIPSSGANKPQKSDIRSWSSWLESMVTSGVLSSGPWFATKAAMTLGYAANTIAIVYNDPFAANNGMYIKVGGSGTGSWAQLTTYLPGYQFVTASPTGASTPNAIVASTSPRLPSGDGVALVTLTIPATNTASSVSVSFDGGPALAIKTRTGEDPDSGELQQNDIVAGFVSGGNFRLITDLNSLRNYQSAKAWANYDEDVPVPATLGGNGVTTFSAKHWAFKSGSDADRSELARDAAESARDQAAGYVNDIVSEKEVPVVGTVQSLSLLDLPVGMAAIRTNGFSALGDGGAWPLVVEVEEDASPLLAWQRQTNDGTRRWELRSESVTPDMMGALGNDSADDTAATQSAADYAAIKGVPFYLRRNKVYQVSKLDLSSNTKLDGLGTIKRRAASTDDYIVKAANAVNVHVSGIRIDGNLAAQTVAYNNLVFIGCSDYSATKCRIYGAKSDGGYGSGIAVVAGENEADGEQALLAENRITDCEGSGIYVSREYNISIEGNLCRDCGVDGIQFANLVYPPVSDVFQRLNVSRNRCLNNGSNGINFIGFYRSFAITGVDLGYGVPPARFVSITGNHCIDNELYGLIWQGAGGHVSGNTIAGNGRADGFGGGLLCNCEMSVIAQNILHDNANFQIDAGGAYAIQILQNNVNRGGVTLGVPTIDIGCGGTRHCIVDGNVIYQEGPQTMVGIKAIGTEATEPSNPINQFGIGITISNNRIVSNGATFSIGMHVTEGFERAKIENNHVDGAPSGRSYFLEVENLLESNNSSSDIFVSSEPVAVVPSGNPVVIPDVGDTFYVSGTANFDVIRTVAANSYHQKVRKVYMASQGSGYSYASPPTVVFSGGGGSGAAGWAQIDTSGRIVDVVMTNLGSGYTSAPSVSFVGGSGSGATAVARIGCNNFAGKKLSLMFQSSLTVANTGNLGLSASHAMTGNSSLRLRGAYGNWYEESVRVA